MLSLRFLIAREREEVRLRLVSFLATLWKRITRGARARNFAHIWLQGLRLEDECERLPILDEIGRLPGRPVKANRPRPRGNDSIDRGDIRTGPNPAGNISRVDRHLRLGRRQLSFFRNMPIGP
jgi:hypothetical protein